MPDYDVIVVGAGNAALAAAMSARENGAAKVLVLEAAHKGMRGGNTHWSGGILRFAFDKPRDIEPLLPGVEEQYLNFYEGVSPYTKDDFMGDLLRVTAGRTDPRPVRLRAQLRTLSGDHQGALADYQLLVKANAEDAGALIGAAGALIATGRLDEAQQAVDRARAIAGDQGPVQFRAAQIGRASCRERCTSWCRSRWSPYH